MIFLGNLQPITSDKSLVGFQHFMPFDPVDGMGKTQAELEKEGILVDSVPEPEVIAGKYSVMYINPQTKQVFYEYNDIPLPDNSLEQKLALMQQAIDDLILGGTL